ncbi:hypothetical protein [Sphingomonas sp. 3-13AW]|uniref:hypothetical protein n=1 Tax=Sphingomonas sp. 3-13AW TaxID=3050450 RepID=UPI003BB7BA00
MSSYSYTDWAQLSETDKKNNPGVSIHREHKLNNPNRGAYWSPETAAQALSAHLEQLLTHPEDAVREQTFNELRGVTDDAFRSQRLLERSMNVRRDDANRASDAYSGYLDETQLTLLADIQTDVALIQKEARALGLDPIAASRRALNIAAGHSVGFDMTTAEASLASQGLSLGSVETMKNAARQLNNSLSSREIDAMDMVESIGTSRSFDEDSRDEHRRMADVLNSIPLALDYAELKTENNPSFRMETAAEASVMETLARQVMKWETLPERETVHEAFSAWRDAGVAESPFSQDIPQTVAVIVGTGPQAAENLAIMLETIRDDGRMGERDVTILAVEPDADFYQTLAEHGRPTIDVVALASTNGVYVDARNPGEQKGEYPTIELMTLNREEANDPIRRSLSANALVARSATVAYVQGANMTVAEAQAIHVAGTARKLSLGIDRDGERMDGKALAKTRAIAISIDKNDDPQRYYTAGLARPADGIYGVGFEASRFADRGHQKHAPGKDIMGDAYDRIPKHATIWAVDEPENANVRWLQEKATERTILYAEAKRTLSFATLADKGLEREKVRTREAGTEITVYDRPASARQYEVDPATGEQRCVTKPLQLNSSRDASQAEIDQVMEDRRKMRGAIVLVTGHAHDRGTLNPGAQEVKVAQEAVADRAHTFIILSDAKRPALSKDMHMAHMTRLAYETNKKTTFINGDGSEMPLDEARRYTTRMGPNREDAINQKFDERMRTIDKQNQPKPSADYAIDSDEGRLALAALPGMDARRAAAFDGVQLTIKEIANNRDPEFHRALHQIVLRGPDGEPLKGTDGKEIPAMPAETLRVINNKEEWSKALDYAEAITDVAKRNGNTIYHPDMEMHPLKLANGPDYQPKSVMIEHTANPDAFDFSKMKLAAFIGGSQPYNEPGELLRREDARLVMEEKLKGVDSSSLATEEGRKVRDDAIASYREAIRDTRETRDPGEKVDRDQVRATVERFSKNGYGIAVALEEGVSKVVLEEAMKVESAKIVVMTPGPIEAAPVKLRNMVHKLVETGRGSVLMPEQIAQAGARVDTPKSDVEQEKFHYDPDKKHFIRPDGSPAIPRKGEVQENGEINWNAGAKVNTISDAELEAAAEPKIVPVYVENRDRMRANLAEIATVAVVVASNERDPAMHTVRQMIEQDKPVAVLASSNPEAFHSEAYSANRRLLRDDGKMMIQSERPAQGVSAQGFAEILEGDTEVTLQGGVMRGNAGTFVSSRFAKDDMLRSGNHSRSFEWENGARPLSSEKSIDRLVAEIDQGLAPVMGRPSVYVERKIGVDGEHGVEKIGRVGFQEEQRSLSRLGAANTEVQEEFSQLSRVHGMDEQTVEKQSMSKKAAFAALEQMGSMRR